MLGAPSRRANPTRRHETPPRSFGAFTHTPPRAQIILYEIARHWDQDELDKGPSAHGRLFCTASRRTTG